jgi:hypothetical protein
MILRIIYTLFLGILVALFVGLGISAFYPAPKSPEAPISVQKYSGPLQTSDSLTPEQKKESEAYEKAQREYYEKTMPDYNKKVSIITLVAAIVILVISLVLVNKILIISDGLLLGGVFTLMYSIGRSFAGADAKYQFVTVSIGLVIAFVLGYLKFIKPEQSK